MDTEILLNEFDDFNNEENIIEPFTDNYYKLKKWLTTIGGQFDAPEWINIKTQANGGQITRPNIKDFFPDKTLQEMMLIYKNNESLFNYIKKLDAYIDELESRLSV